ncbi:MAG: class I SAM-dependent methyltransferase [Candidatus Cloacimonetes bacterium]|nr:class I SAM-dependent methyltransferase [Candidatus Cloacimonadota bacterium]
MITYKEIEDFIINAGSDDLPTFGGKYEGGIHCQQIPDEIASYILAILKFKQKIESYLEIGVAAGGTTYLFNHFFSLKKIVLIDDNKHHKAKLRPEVLRDVTYQEIIGRSETESSVETVSKVAPFDLIMIDGDHSYPGVKLDTVLYMPLLNPGGFLIYHDSNKVWGVQRVVRELKNDSSMEFIDEYISKQHPRPCGIALFRKKDRSL